MASTVFVFIPPFTQLNTPYPASAYLKGFLNTKNISCTQADLGLEVILKVFSKAGLGELFNSVQVATQQLSGNSARIFSLKNEYLKTIEPVVNFLQGKNPSLALSIVQDSFLPCASRFDNLLDPESMDYFFGSMGIQDKAKYLATLYLEDLSDFIIENVDPYFGFSRYAEKLGRSAYTFDGLYAEIKKTPTYTDGILIEILADKINTIKPELVLISVPFPGNLYAAFRCGAWLKKAHPKIKIAMGGGFPNTELRSLSDPRVFEFTDYITLDDGETPVEELLRNLKDKSRNVFKRTYTLQKGKVEYINNSTQKEYSMKEVGTPDYSDLYLDKYLSVIEVVNPMHKMWSDGRWNKLTLAHGCYWGKCTFCDTSLDYIKNYEPLAAKLLCDRIEEIISQTGQTGFHFVDEAAPPSLMKELALEIIRRNLVLTWWTNIRFEKSFTFDLCRLLKTSGCVAVSGGLEVASDRLLQLIDKGVSVQQVAQVTKNFTDSGIMVHAYLMYGYPSQSIQETVDSLELVRQLFEQGILQSAYWHQFALTAHSPIALSPKDYGITILPPKKQSFALNDLEFKDSTGINHEMFSFGLKKSLLNFMHGIGLDWNLQTWFDFKIPKTKVHKDFIYSALAESGHHLPSPSAKMLFLGTVSAVEKITKTIKGKKENRVVFTIINNKSGVKIEYLDKYADLLDNLFANSSINSKKLTTFSQFKAEFEVIDSNFLIFWHSKEMDMLREEGLLVV